MQTPPSNEIVIFFYPYYIREISKALSCNMPCEFDANLYDQHALVIIACMDFIQHRHDKSFLVDNFNDFPDVLVKKKKNLDFILSLVVFRSGGNICYCYTIDSRNYLDTR